MDSSDDSPMFNRQQYGSSAPLYPNDGNSIPPYPKIYVQAPPTLKTQYESSLYVEAPGTPSELNHSEFKSRKAQTSAQFTNVNVTAWTSNIHSCCEDGFTCCLTTCCPCITFGQIAQSVDEDESSCLVNGLIYVAGCMLMVPCFCSWGYRKKLRQKYNLPEEPYSDFWTHFCFEPCALCQEYRELKNRGVDPTQVIPLQMVAPTQAIMK
ncbi:hypothetical protein O6H91_02G080400 [Diphasiastrum complanatum]|uniref:Uncharacterized protein n=1 Tax=Diphasiastrum complanatum TaxID=34168 RepID=A0ACC2EHC5_DIPCM|nr:hypothetical protein O6H91_02G080400 [Diphasiastrum complanatum]